MPAANIGSYFIRVSLVLQVQFPLAIFVPGDKDALRKPLRNIAENVSGNPLYPGNRIHFQS